MCTVGKLNKSFSESDLCRHFDNSSVQDSSYDVDKRFPLMRKRVLFVEQIIYGDSHSILRSASCNLVLDGSDLNQSHNQNNFSANNTVANTFYNNCNGSTINSSMMVNENYVTNDGITPMDVDIVCNNQIVEDHLDFVETMDVDGTLENNCNSGKSLNKTNIRRRQSSKLIPTCSSKLIPITSISKKKSFQCGHFILISIVIAISLMLYMLFFETHVTLYVNSNVQSENIRKDLLEQVYEQKSSVSVIVRSLKDRAHWESQTKVLAFVGPPGVGKTFSATIIKKHFDQRLIHELYGMHVSYEKEWYHILNKLKPCCLNLIIIDNLMKVDSTNLFALIHSLPKKQYNLVIAIFNIAYANENLDYTIAYQDIIGIHDKLDHSGLNHEMVVFRAFSAEQAKSWLEKQFDSKYVDSKLKKTIVTNVLNGHNVTHKGLKGLYSKLLLELETYSH